MLMTCNGDIWFRDMWGETCWYINWSVSSMLTSLSTPLTGLNLLVIPIIQVQTSSMRRFYSQWSLQAERKILRRHDRRKDLVFWSVADLTSRQTVDLQGATKAVAGPVSLTVLSFIFPLSAAWPIVICILFTSASPVQTSPDQSKQSVFAQTPLSLFLATGGRKETQDLPQLKSPMM